MAWIASQAVDPRHHAVSATPGTTIKPRHSAPSTASMPRLRPRRAVNAPKPRSGAPKARGLTDPSTAGGQSNAPSDGQRNRQPCLRTTVSYVPGPYNKPGHDGESHTGFIQGRSASGRYGTRNDSRSQRQSRYSGICPNVLPHFPWDATGYPRADNAAAKTVPSTIGSPHTFRRHT
jgi:hypothetical protein